MRRATPARLAVILAIAAVAGAGPPATAPDTPDRPDPPATPPAAPPAPVVEIVEIAGARFRLELATDEAARLRGLGGRPHVGDDGGMLFVFPDRRRRWFWMADCLVDIDLLFLDHRGRIVARHAMRVEPARGADEPLAAYRQRLPRYPSRRPAEFAIELKAGSIARLGLRGGDVITLDRPRLRAMARR